VGVLGDSRTYILLNTWGSTLISDLNTDHVGDMIFTEENPRNWAVGGTDIIEAAAAIDGWLINHTINPIKDKNIFLINFGIITAIGETEANFKSSYLYIIDAIKVKFPDAKIYLTYPWSTVAQVGTRPALVKPWIADIIAARSTFVFEGDDENVWLEGGDDGATNTSDGCHYNAAGQAAKIVAVRAVLGY
jgi:hypothetical protein